MSPNDVCLLSSGEPVEAIVRYHDILARLAGRNDLRDDTTKYEAVALVLAKSNEPDLGAVIPAFPPRESLLSLDSFFVKLYRAYDLRFVFSAPKLEAFTKRLLWEPDSPALADPRASDHVPRVGSE